MLKARVYLPRLSCLAVALMMGLGLVACSEDDTVVTPPPPPGPPPANAFGAIKIFADDGAADCSITGNPTGLMTVYLFHTDHQGVTGSQFKIESTGTGFVWIADQPAQLGLEIGNTSIGSSFAYGRCVGGDFNFATVIYQCNGTADPCSQLKISAHDQAGGIFAVSCADAKSDAYGAALTVNCASSNNCGEPYVAATQSTWGAIQQMHE